MTSALRIARVAGVEIRAHWSLLVVAALLVWSLADGVFPETDPGLSDDSYLAMALVAALLFLASIVLHELGHAAQARREGVPVGGITLWVFGGVAELRGDMPSPGAELRMAAAGPAVSLVLGAVCLGAALALPLPAEVDGVLFWLGQINLSLLVFNLIPALPLDGGRMLRALLWARRGDLLAATRTAGALGRGFGRLLIAGGLVLAIVAGDFGGLWLVFLGWFLLAAAEAELATTSARAALAGLTVADLMVRDPVAVPATVSVQAFMDEIFLPTRHTAFPVLDGVDAVGIVSFRRALGLPPEHWPVTAVRAITETGPDVEVAADAPLAEALPRLMARDLRRLLVMHDGRAVGLLSPTDVMRVLEVRTRAAAPERRRTAPAPARPRSRTILRPGR
jgi:Zn-dependent protease/CBS domain-containing protein